jgi:ATP-dependent Clp protease protease subunit
MTTPWQPPTQPPPEPVWWPTPRAQPWPLTQRGDSLVERLLERRIVLLHGHLDHERATEAAAMLLTLDADSTEPVSLRMDVGDGDLGAALLLADTIDLMHAPVHLVCTGEIAGPPVLVLSAADRREATPHARFVLREPRLEVSGTADQVSALARQQATMLDQMCQRLAELTGRTPDEIREDLRSPGRFLSAEDAVAYGLVERVTRQPATGPRR